MKKKAKPTELSANLQPTSKDQSRSRLPSKGKLESGQPTQKKTHHKIFSMADSYYYPNIYKSAAGDKSKGNPGKNVTLPSESRGQKELSDEQQQAEEAFRPDAPSRDLGAGASSKFVGLKEKHRRASSQGEKNIGKHRSTSKTKNQSFFEAQTDDRRQPKPTSQSKLNTLGSNTNFLSRLKKIWKTGQKAGLPNKTRDSSFISGNHQRAPSNPNDTDKHSHITLHKNTSAMNRAGEGSLSKGRKVDQTGDWPKNGQGKAQQFDTKNILRNLKETSLEKRRAGEERFASMSGMKDASQSGSKCRTIKEGKSRALNDFIQSLNRQLEHAAAQLALLKRDLVTGNYLQDREEFVKKIKSLYNFAEKIKTSEPSEQVRKLCDKLLEEVKLTFDVVVEHMVGSEYDRPPGKKLADKSVSAEFRDILLHDPDQLEFLEGVKSFAKLQLKDWPKKEFRIAELYEFFEQERLPLFKPSFDAEKQKLTKTYVDLLQKQFIFDEVLKIIEEEGIDIENLFLAAFERLGEAAQKEEDSALSGSREELDELTESRKDSDNGSRYSDQLLVNLNSSAHQERPANAQNDKLKLNFSAIKEMEGGAPGFHEEFMKNLDNFSLSWRMQALKEMERGKRPAGGQSES